MKLNYIDTMRGIAILMVVLVHTAQPVVGKSNPLALMAEYGQMGVQLFFVASAFTLCHSWFGRHGERSKLIKYGIRRFFRIAPMFYLALILYFLLSIAENFYKLKLIEPAEQYTVVNILVNMLFLHGFYPLANNNVVPGGWSIGTEMAFYVVFPLLVTWLSKIKINLLSASIIICLTIFISQAFVFLIYVFTGKAVSNNNFLYFNMVVQGPVFIIGMVFYFLNKEDLWPFRSTYPNALGFIFFTALALVLWKLREPNYYSIIPIISGFSFVFLFKVFELNDALNSPLIRRIGAVSYSMYLLHFIFAHKLNKLISNRLTDFLGADIAVLVLFLSTASLTFMLAVFSQRYFEAFFIDQGKRLISKLGKR
ncbi:acyltransferase family protein [Pseudomonas sp. S1_E04]